jgi:hypothetical protein
MRLSSVCFVYATLCVIVGMILGMWMGIAQDFTLAPAHAHLNLIGWVSVFLIGLYHRSQKRATTRLDRWQAGLLMLGIPGFAGSLAVHLTTSDPAVEALAFPFTVGGTLLCLFAMILLLVIVIRDGRKPV